MVGLSRKLANTGVSSLEYRQGAGSIAPVGKYAVTGGGGQPGVRIFLQVGDTGNNFVWIRVLGVVVINDEDGGEYPCGVPMSDHGESGKIPGRRVMGDNGGQGGAACGRYAVGGHLHRPSEGNGITVGVPTTTHGGMRMGKRL